MVWSMGGKWHRVTSASYPDVSLDVRAKEGGKETCTLPMVPCGSSPVTRFALASAIRKTKRLRRRLAWRMFYIKCVESDDIICAQSENSGLQIEFCNLFRAWSERFSTLKWNSRLLTPVHQDMESNSLCPQINSNQAIKPPLPQWYSNPVLSSLG